MKKVCMHCGMPEEDHHEYRASMPDGCVCAPGEWGDEVNEVCRNYRAGETDYCLNCEHDKECHKSTHENAQRQEKLLE